MAKKDANKAEPVRTAGTETNKARLIAGVILVILLLALIGFMIWFILDRTNGGTEDFRTFAVTVDGEEVRSTNERRSLLQGEHTVSADYLFGGDYDYTVDIVPASGIRFNYTVDGIIYAWNAETNLSQVFGLEKGESGFSFTVPTNLAAVLAALHPDADVVAPKEGELKDPYIYALVISSYNQKTTYTITFSIAVPIEGVGTDKPNVQFP